MRVTWINPTQIREVDGRKTCERVCVRLRSILPGEYLARQGHDVSCVALGDLAAYSRFSRFYDRDVFVFGKTFFDCSPLIAEIRARSKAKIVFDLCDNVFEPPEDTWAPAYQAMLPQSDAILTSSEALSEAILSHLAARLPAYALADPVENERIAPTFGPEAGKLRLLWFGYPFNIVFLANELERLRGLAERFEVEVTAVCNWEYADENYLLARAEGLALRFVNWSVPTMAEELARCDLVIIPSDDSPARVTKSANRLITGLWAGKYVASYPLPSYREFADYASVVPNLVEGIEWALEHPEQVVSRIRAGQDHICAQYGPDVIGSQWERILAEIVTP